jgi:chromosome segregation ATPase
MVCATTWATPMLGSASLAHATLPYPQQKDYLSESEADKIRDADTAALRIKLYISFAEDRLKKFEYEIHRTVPERRRAEILNALLNGYSACVDDAADQIDAAQEKQQDIREALKMLRVKNKEFLETLQKYQKDGPELDTYRDTLEDAIEGTKDALSDVDDAEKEATPGPVRRKPS